MGSHIGYRAIDSVTYEITLTIYNDCNSIPVSASDIKVTGKSSGPYNSTAQVISSTDITGAYLGCNFVSRCSGSYPYGMKEYKLIDTVDVSGGACEYIFSYESCCRNGSISTGGANSLHYNYAVLNKCYGMNNSVKADVIPLLLLPSGKDVSIVNFLGDRTDNDSVGYRLVDPTTAYNTPMPFSGAFSATTPLSFLGFPNQSLNFPSGFNINEFTSEIRFRPTVTNQVGVICVEAQEFRRINGVMERVGVSRIEYQVIVIPSVNNVLPKISGASVEACSDRKTCIDLIVEDVDKNDTTAINVSFLPPGATVTYGSNGKHATAQVCWTPTKNDVRNHSYTFFVNGNDGTCIMGSRATRVFSFLVRKAPDSSDVEIVSKTVQCSSAEIVVKNNNLSVKDIQLIDEDSVSLAQGLTSRLYFKGSGWKKFYVKFISLTSCDYVITDSVFITPQYGLQLNGTPDTAICPYDSIGLYTLPLNGNAPYNYEWYSKNLNVGGLPAMAAIKTVIDAPTHFYSIVKDSNHCIGLDTVKVGFKPLPYIDAGVNDTVCPQAPFQLQAVPYGGISVAKYEWQGVDTLRTVTTQTAGPKWYYAIGYNAEGCRYIDSVHISTRAINVNAGTYAAQCVGTTVQLVATSTEGLPPLKYTWGNSTINNNVLSHTITADSAIIVKMEDSLGCVAYDTAFIKANALPTFTPPANTATCMGTPVVLQLTNLTGAGPLIIRWNGLTGSAVRTVNPTTTTDYVIIVSDSNLCATAQTTRVTVNSNPAVNIGLNRTVCKGTQVTLNGFVTNGTAPFNYLWSDGSTANSITKTANTAQQIILSVTDVNGCIGSDTTLINVHPTQTATLPTIGTICETDNPIGLKALPNTGVWSGAGVATNLFIPQLAGPGKHYIRYNFTSVYGCPESDSIFANIKQQPIVDFVADKTLTKTGTPINFTNQTVADTAYTVFWDLGDAGAPGNTVSTQNATHTYNNQGKYSITLTVFNGVCAAQTIKKTNYIVIDNSLSTGGIEGGKVTVYPNPAENIITIDAQNPIMLIEVYDVLGKKVIHQPINAALNNQINVQHLTAGTYMLKLTDQDGNTYRTSIMVAH